MSVELARSVMNLLGIVSNVTVIVVSNRKLQRGVIDYLDQSVAAGERRSADARHTATERHARQAIAIIERIITDRRHFSMNRNARQDFAFGERRSADARDRYALIFLCDYNMRIGSRISCYDGI